MGGWVGAKMGELLGGWAGARVWVSIVGGCLGGVYDGEGGWGVGLVHP